MRSRPGQRRGQRFPIAHGPKRGIFRATADIVAASLRGRRTGVEKIGNGGHKLRGGKWLRQHDAVGHAL